MLENNISNNKNIEEEEKNSVNLSQSISLNNSILNQLIDLGINQTYAKRIFKYYHPLDLYEALDYFYSNDGIIQHRFIENEKKSGNDCYLCGEKKEIHLGYKPNDNNNDNDIQYVDSENKLNKSNIDNNIEYNKEDIKKSIQNEDIKLDVEPQNICEVCNENFIPNEHNKIEKCGHSFCNDCWFQYLSIKIEENKIFSIKCLDDKCEEKLSDDFIFYLLNNNENLIKKYKRYKFEYEIINDPNKKFCPFQNCDSYLELKDIRNKDVKCLNNHSFCFLCLKEPHGKLPCEQNLDSSMLEFAKTNFIKFCPNCHILTEKTSGCNHIKCSKCNYEWCWLCNEKYIDVNHYKNGKCKGLQLFRPENEYDIKLAFEGKIKLNDSQIQIDEDFLDNNHFYDRNNINFNRIIFPINVNNNVITLFNSRNKIRHISKKLKNICKALFLFFYYLLFGYFIIIKREYNEIFYSNNVFYKFVKFFISGFFFFIYYPIHFPFTILIMIIGSYKFLKDLFFGYFLYSLNISKRIYYNDNFFYKFILIFINCLFFIVFYPIHFHILLFYRLIIYIYYEPHYIIYYV